VEVSQVIVFNLKCGEGHAFEEWFASSGEYEAKAAARALVCPECGSTHIEKGLSAPRQRRRAGPGARSRAVRTAGLCRRRLPDGELTGTLPSGAHADHGTVLKPTKAALVVGEDGLLILQHSDDQDLSAA
jgi:hypothetical protein